MKLQSCRLATIEENILNEARVDDIPGAMIPGIFFKYISDRDANDIKKVMKHNKLDVLSMAALLYKVAAIIHNPLTVSDGGHELLGVGRIYENKCDSDSVITCYEACMNSNNLSVRDTASRRLGDAYKRNRDYERAIGHWEQMLENSGSFDTYPLIELAKYYEHKEKNIDKATKLVERALEISFKLDSLVGCKHDDLKKRLERLKSKWRRNKILGK